ncbi:putative ATP-dependent RNA helicase DHX57 [Polyodon spathula]|uniref:putative ATP-dependent RNA helicase DHX57 n=1 Tax=Polyodon spathula TaxID=7913 RepID=UPI001B7DBED6|nr:putative ATP-dependent RNA helicase DHX57 [Polyodon spathula]XP_041108105.1 putative ATP-dependent RNA helicase DHX57 [Polyodon spathula]
MSGRRKAKPNRGGGRFNKPRGGGGGGRGKSGGGGGGARKAADNSWDDGDDFSLFCGPSRPPRPGGRGRGRGAVGGSSSSRGRPKTDSGARPRPRPEENGRPRPKTELPRMPMQKIHMTSENQASVKELLRELQTQDFEEPDENCEEYSGSEPEEEEYDELDYRDDGQFWCTNDDPVEVSDSAVFEPDSEEEREVCEIPISYVAIGKLSRYGFDKERCKLALQSCNREVGVSLEYLLQQCFKEKYGKRARSIATCRDITMEDCLVQRQEEAFALSSIYGDRFTERIHNRVWTVTVALEFLIEKSNNHKQGSANKETSQVLLKDVCRFYLKGAGCRFGTKCRFKHQMPTEPCPNTKKPMGPSQSSFDSNTPPVYELEIRFPEGNRYPFQAPVVAFTTTDETVLFPGRLHVSEYLYGEALVAAELGEPVVFTLITCLEDEAKMSELLANNHHKYSVPPPPLPAVAPAKSKSVKRVSPVQDVPKQLEVKKAVESEEEEEEEDLDDPPAVPVENESYVNFKKKFTKKYEWKAESVQQENAKLCRQFRNKQSSRRFLSMLQERQKLPAWQEKKNILEMLSRSQVLVVSGMTGCGKTTQIPQFILDDTLKGPAGKVANIICTQPRRISAISVAERVAQERAERLGTTVGYQIRLETVKSSATRLLYCTTGVLLRRLEGDTDLQGVTHVIVDEVHERTEESDFLLLVLKDIMIQRSDLRIILMSATLNAELFSQYFFTCPTINIPGRTFPVDQFFLEDALAKTRYVIEDGSPYMRSGKQGNQTSKGKNNRNAVEQLEDDMWSFMHFQKDEFVKDSIPDQQLTIQQMTVRYKGVSKSVLKTMAAMDLEKINMDLVEAVLEWIVDGDHSYPPGAVLVFMPGLAEIKMLYEQLQSNRLFNGRRNARCAIYPLHSSLSSEEQQAVFNRPPEGVTKIIISTNIAETSVTIDDVVYVIDSGKMKEKRYDASKSMESLEDSWVSRANALQRRGRAGRVASGVCFHLFTSHCFRHQLTEQQLPEIQRVPLEQLCLRIKILDMFADQPLEFVFSSLIEPPAANSVEAAKQRLQDLGALTPDEKLTPLGYHLASLPVDVRIGKLMLFGAIFRCLDPALTIAASLAFKSPFVSPWDKREEANMKKMEFALGNSDHLALLQAYKGWKSAAKQGSQAGFRYCRENFLSGRVLQEIASLKRQFAELLSDIGFVKDGLKARVIERMSSKGEDGILEATGHEANSNADNIKLMSAMLCAALYPNVVQVRAPQGKYQLTSKGAVKMQPKADELKFMTKNDGSVHVHPSSVNYPVRHFDSPYLVYHEKVKTSRVFIRDCSMVSVYPLVLFGGGQVKVDLQRGEFVISLDDGWICFAATSHQVAELVKELRWELDQLLEDKIKNPTMDLCSCPRGSRIIDMIVKLVTTQ